MKLSNEARNVLNAEASRQLLAEVKGKKNSLCAWCNPGAGDEKTSHGMCEMHAQQMIDEILADRKKREQIEALPKPLKAATKSSCPCYCCRTNNMFGCSRNAGAADYQAVRGF
jgi:hypothetical protein